MAGSKSAYLRNVVLDEVLSGVAFTAPASVYIALSTAAFSATSTGAAMTEVSGGGYTRVAVTANATNFPLASGGSKSNGTSFTFPTATAGWGTVMSFYVVDAATAGNVLYGGDLSTSRTILTGDTASFAAGAMTFTET